MTVHHIDPALTVGKLYLRRTGYVFKLYYVYKVNKLIKKGLIKSYLKNRVNTAEGVRLINNSAL